MGKRTVVSLFFMFLSFFAFSESIYVVLGSFKNENNAVSRVQFLKKSGIETFVGTCTGVKGAKFFRVFYDRKFSTDNSAFNCQKELSKNTSIKNLKESLWRVSYSGEKTKYVFIENGKTEVVEKIVEVVKTVEVVKEVPVEKIVEVIKEVPVEKEVVKIIPIEKIVEVIKEVPVPAENLESEISDEDSDLESNESLEELESVESADVTDVSESSDLKIDVENESVESQKLSESVNSTETDEKIEVVEFSESGTGSVDADDVK